MSADRRAYRQASDHGGWCFGFDRDIAFGRRSTNSAAWKAVLVLMCVGAVVIGPTRGVAFDGEQPDQAEDGDRSNGDEADETDADSPVAESPPATLDQMSRSELEEAGFVFEDTVSHRERAHATVFALAAGAVVPGAGHWHLDDSTTALGLVVADVSALTLLAGGTFLALRPTGSDVIDDRRHELWFLGAGLLGSTWMLDIIGTAYRDDLGIPDSTRRRTGWGVEARYEYQRPPDLSMRHLSSLEANFRSRQLELDVQTAQELGWGMSDYRAGARWFPVVGTNEVNRVGLELSGRLVQYRLDDPFRRLDVVASLEASFNMGRLFAHLDEMEAGFSAGYGLSARRTMDDQDRWMDWRRQADLIPMRMYLALNLTEPLRFEAAFERGARDWIELQPTRVGIPVFELTYRSADRVDLRFFSAFGNGTALGSGLRFWFGE